MRLVASYLRQEKNMQKGQHAYLKESYLRQPWFYQILVHNLQSVKPSKQSAITHQTTQAFKPIRKTKQQTNRQQLNYVVHGF